MYYDWFFYLFVIMIFFFFLWILDKLILYFWILDFILVFGICDSLISSIVCVIIVYFYSYNIFNIENLGLGFEGFVYLYFVIY